MPRDLQFNFKDFPPAPHHCWNLGIVILVAAKHIWNPQCLQCTSVDVLPLGDCWLAEWWTEVGRRHSGVARVEDVAWQGRNGKDQQTLAQPAPEHLCNVFQSYWKVVVELSCIVGLPLRGYLGAHSAVLFLCMMSPMVATDTVFFLESRQSRPCQNLWRHSRISDSGTWHKQLVISGL